MIQVLLATIVLYYYVSSAHPTDRPRKHVSLEHNYEVVTVGHQLNDTDLPVSCQWCDEEDEEDLTACEDCFKCLGTFCEPHWGYDEYDSEAYDCEDDCDYTDNDELT